MWQTVISIDNKYSKEIEYIKSYLEKIPELFYAQQMLPSRAFFNIAGKEKELCLSQIKIHSLIAEVITTHLKCNFFKSRIKGNYNSLPKDCLLASLVFYEQEKDFHLVQESLDDVYEYSIDGILNFKFKSLLESWEEMSDMLLNLLDSNPKDSDLWGVTAYLLGGRRKNQSLLIADSELPLISVIKSKKILPIIDLFDDKMSNVSASIIAHNPSEIIVDNTHCDNALWGGLKNVFPIKLI